MFTFVRQTKHANQGNICTRHQVAYLESFIASPSSGLAIRIGAVLLFTFSGCSTLPEGGVHLLDQTLGFIGLQRAGIPGSSSERRFVSGKTAENENKRLRIRLHAAQLLNGTERGQPLPVVAKLYKLKNRTAFELAPYKAFQESDLGKYPDILADVVESREIILAPGEKYDAMEKLAENAPYFAVVILFRFPADRRWRFVFDSNSAATTGITLGVHRCAASVAVGQPLNIASEFTRVASVRCDTVSL